MIMVVDSSFSATDGSPVTVFSIYIFNGILCTLPSDSCTQEQEQCTQEQCPLHKWRGHCSDVEDHNQKIHRSWNKLWQEHLVLDVVRDKPGRAILCTVKLNRNMEKDQFAFTSMMYP